MLWMEHKNFGVFMCEWLCVCGAVGVCVVRYLDRNKDGRGFDRTIALRDGLSALKLLAIGRHIVLGSVLNRSSGRKDP